MLRAIEQRLGWIVGKTQEGETQKLTPLEQALSDEGFRERIRNAQAYLNDNPVLPIDKSFVAWGIKRRNRTIDFQEITRKDDELAISITESKDFRDGLPVLVLFVIQALAKNDPHRSFPNPSYKDLRRLNRINRMANDSNTALIVAAIDQIEKKVDILCIKEPQTWGFGSVSDQVDGSRQKAVDRQLRKATTPQEVVAILGENHYRVIPVIRIPSDTLDFSEKQLADVRKLD